MRPGSANIKNHTLSRTKLGLMMIAVSLLVIVTVISFTLSEQHRQQSIAIKSDGLNLIHLLTSISQNQILSKVGTNNVEGILTHQLNNTDLDYWVIVGLHDEVLASGSAPNANIPPTSIRSESLPPTQTSITDAAQGINYQDFQTPLLSDGKPVGSLRIGYAAPQWRNDVTQIPFLTKISLPIFLLTPLFYFLTRRGLNSGEALANRLKNLVNNSASGMDAPSQHLYIGDTSSSFSDNFTQLEECFEKLLAEKNDVIASNHILSYQRRKLELVLQTIPYAIVIMDEDGNATFTNAKTEILLGIAANQIIGQKPQYWCNSSALTGFLLKYQSNVSPLFRSNRMELSPLNSPNRTLEVNVHPLLQPDNLNDSLGTLAIFRDITKEVTARQGRDEFISHVAHELKSPLNIIHMFVDMLLSDESLELEQKIESLNSINDQTERLSTLISNLLNITKIESGTLSLATQHVNTRDFLQDTFTAAASNRTNTDLSFEIKLPKTLSSISVDKELFRVALNNLLSNAVKYNRPGGTIGLEAEENENNLTIRIFDSGIGIDPEDQSRIFDKFYRSETQEVLEKNGQGLGLALVKQIIEIHHGTITLESEKGKGSEFTISLKKTANLLKQAV